MKIIVHLMGGLGNQLFQYAIGRRICSLNPGAELLLTFEDGYKLAHRNYTLEHLQIEGVLATLETLKVIGPERGLGRRLRKWTGLAIDRNVIREQNPFEFDPTLLKVKQDCYLVGFWQSFRYAQGIELQLCKEFYPRQLSQEFFAMNSTIQTDKQSIALHIRRSDYLNAASGFSVLPLDYYKAAVEFVKVKLGLFNIYVFTDDPAWAESSFLPSINYQGNIRIVSNLSLKDYEELTLMSNCMHAIIANSSFSWWGAWLNRNADKLIIVPKNWNGKNDVIKLKDLIPPEWVLL